MPTHNFLLLPTHIIMQYNYLKIAVLEHSNILQSLLNVMKNAFCY